MFQCLNIHEYLHLKCFTASKHVYDDSHFEIHYFILRFAFVLKIHTFGLNINMFKKRGLNWLWVTSESFDDIVLT